MPGTSVVFDILANDRASSKFAAVGRAADHSTSRMSKWGGALKASAAVGLGALAYGATSFIKSSIDIEKQFSTSMRLIQAATGAPAAEMGKLNDLAIKLGADTSFSAGEAADAMLELAKAGLDTSTIMGGALSGTLTLAAAGGTQLGTAATIASNALNTFNLKGKDMAKVAAALAGGANASSASVESLGQGLQQVGPGATNAGLSLQETVAALSAFDAAGVKGSDAGTSLKTMLANLVPQTDKAAAAMEKYHLDFTTADGDFVSLTNMSEQLKQGLGNLSEEQRTQALTTIFGSDASRAATVLMKEGEKGIRGYIKATNDQAAAQKMAAARMGGTEGAMERLSGSIETAKLRLGQELAPVVVKIADGLDDKLVPAMDNVIDGGKQILTAVKPAFTEIAQALGHLVGQGDKAGNVFEDQFIPALKTTADAIAAVVNFIDNLPGPVKKMGVEVGVAAFALGKLSAAMIAIKETQFVTNMMAAETRTKAFGTAAKAAAGVGGILLLAHSFSDTASEGHKFRGVLEGFAGGAALGFAAGGPIGALIGAAGGGGLMGLRAAFTDTADEARAARRELARGAAFADAAADADKLSTALQGVVHEYGAISRAKVEANFYGDDGKLESSVQGLRDMGLSMDTIVSATMGQTDALKLVRSQLDGYKHDAEVALQTAQDHVAALAQLQTDYAQRKPGEIVPIVSADDLVEASKAVDDAKASLDALNDIQDEFAAKLNGNTEAIRLHQNKVAELTDALNIGRKAYAAWPKSVRMDIEANDLPQTSADLLRLIKQYKGLQSFGRIKALVSAPGARLAYDDVLRLQKRYKLNPHQVRTLFKQEGIPTSLQGIARLTKRLQLTPKKITTLLTALGIDATVGKVKSLQKQLQETARQRTAPKVEVDPKPAIADMHSFSRVFGDLDKKPSRPKIDIDPAPAINAMHTVSRVLQDLNGDHADTYIYTHHVDTYSHGGGGGGGGGGAGSNLTPRMILPTTERSLISPRLLARGLTVNAAKFHGLGAGVVHAFAQGINGSAHESETAVDHMMAAIAKALKNKNITEAAAKQMREAVQAMAKEADKGRSMLAKRADYANTLRDSFSGELGLGELVSSETFGGIGDITGGAQALAARLKAFAGQLTELRHDGIPKGLISEIASLGSDQGSKAAAAILAGTQGEENALSQAYNSFQNAAGLAANTAANTQYGTVGQIKNEFHVTIHAGLGSNPRQIATEVEKVLSQLSREQGRQLNFRAKT